MHSLYNPATAPVVGITGMVEKSQGRIGGSADPSESELFWRDPSPSPIGRAHHVVLVDAGRGDLVGVVVSHPHEMVQEPGQKQLSLAEDCSRRIAIWDDVILFDLQTPEQEYRRHSLHHQLWGHFSACEEKSARINVTSHFKRYV